MSISMTQNSSGLPDPATQSAFYEGVLIKRFFAWIVDVVIISAISALVATLPLFIGWFFFPLIFLAVYVVYCVATIGAKSATLGMRLFNIELRNTQGAALSGSEAALHTVIYLIASAFFLPQVISVIMMFLGERGQGLHDHLAGAALINRPSHY